MSSLLLLLFLSVSVQADVMARIQKDKTVKVGVSLFAPWTLKDKQGNLIGYEIDLAKIIAADLGVEPEFKLYPWEDIIPALQKGEIDFIAAGMAITPQRAMQLTFTRPYMKSGVSLVTHTAKTQDLEALSDLNQEDKTLAVVKDTLAMDVAFKLFDQARVQIFPELKDAQDAIIKGDALAYIGSIPEVTFLSLRYPEVVDIPLQTPLRESRAGFGVKLGEQSMVNFLNAWIEAREADGSLTAAYSYWFRSLDWAERVEP